MSRFKGELLGFAMPLPEVEESPIFMMLTLSKSDVFLTLLALKPCINCLTYCYNQIIR